MEKFTFLEVAGTRAILNETIDHLNAMILPSITTETQITSGLSIIVNEIKDSIDAEKLQSVIRLHLNGTSRRPFTEEYSAYKENITQLENAYAKLSAEVMKFKRTITKDEETCATELVDTQTICDVEWRMSQRILDSLQSQVQLSNMHMVEDIQEQYNRQQAVLYREELCKDVMHSFHICKIKRLVTDIDDWNNRLEWDQIKLDTNRKRLQDSYAVFRKTSLELKNEYFRRKNVIDQYNNENT